MSTFFQGSISRLLPGQMGKYEHWFGGSPTHLGAVPDGCLHPVHLLYDLDLSDPQLGLSSRFPGVSRLPLYNALQYNCSDMVYRPVSEDRIEILSIESKDWMCNHPYNNYPASFPRTPVRAEPLTAKEVSELNEAETEVWAFPRIGGVHHLWQGQPVWECPNPRCESYGNYTDNGKEVFAVIWEKPVPGIHLWDDSANPVWRTLGGYHLMFSRCQLCGVIHSCNRA